MVDGARHPFIANAHGPIIHQNIGIVCPTPGACDLMKHPVRRVQTKGGPP